jgi:Fe-S-cluster containining protein
LAAYTDRRWPGTESFLLMHINAACVFLETTPETHLSLCRIHSFKPACCREWEAGIHKPECQTGLSKLLGIKVDSSLNLAANEEQLRRLAERTKAIGDLTDD